MRTTVTKRYIDATPQVKAKLAKVFKVTEKYIYLCLTYRNDSDTARKIRFTAVKNYGATPMVHYPLCETLHDTTEGGREIMRQEFDNGVTLRVDKHTGELWLTNRKGVEVMRGQIKEFPELAKFQVMAENM